MFCLHELPMFYVNQICHPPNDMFFVAIQFSIGIRNFPHSEHQLIFLFWRKVCIDQAGKFVQRGGIRLPLMRFFKQPAPVFGIFSPLLLRQLFNTRDFFRSSV